MMQTLDNCLTFKNNKDKEKIQGIYAIKVNNKIVYVGQSTNIIDRCRQHSYKIIKPIEECKKYKGDLSPLYIELRKMFYNDYCIEFIVLEEIDNKNELRQKEKYYMNKYSPSLNIHHW